MTQVAAAMLLGVEVSANAALVHVMTVSAVAQATVSRSGGVPRMWQVINMVAPHSAVTSPAHGTAESWPDAMGERNDEAECTEARTDDTGQAQNTQRG